MKNFSLKRLLRKLDYIKIRLFLINRVRLLINYKLRLPLNTRKHLVFISLN